MSLLGAVLAPEAASAAAAQHSRDLGTRAAVAQHEDAAVVTPFANGPQGCNHSVCIYTAYTGSGYQAWAEFRVNVTSGHHHIWGPGLNVNTPNGPWNAGQDSRRYNGRGNGQVCAEGWSYSGGAWHSIGLPCVTIG